MYKHDDANRTNLNISEKLPSRYLPFDLSLPGEFGDHRTREFRFAASCRSAYISRTVSRGGTTIRVAGIVRASTTTAPSPRIASDSSVLTD